MTRKLAETLELDGPVKQLNLSVAAGKSVRSKEKGVYFALASVLPGVTYVTPPLYALTTKVVANCFPPVQIKPDIFPHLRDITFTYDYPQRSFVNIDLILNCQDTLMLMVGSVRHGPTIRDPKAIITKLGAAFCGSYDGGFQMEAVSQSVARVASQDELEELQLLKDFMSIEQLGTDGPDDGPPGLTSDEIAAVELLKETTTYDEATRSYTVGLLWKLDPALYLDSNLGRSIAVCKQFKRRSLANPQLARDVDAVYRDQLDRGMTFIVPEDQWELDRPFTVIPSHPVFKPSSRTTKIRIVHNASSKCRSGMSLNDCLHAGPSLIPDIASLMLTFRTTKYFVVFDVSKCFWRISICQADSPFQRFVWQFGTDPNAPLQMLESTVVTFGVSSSPFLSMGTTHNHCDKVRDKFPLGAEAIKKRTYVDDGSAIDNDRPRIVKTTKEMYDVLWLASLVPHQWNASDVSILDEAGIPKHLQAEADTQNFLGMKWHRKGDLLHFDFSNILDHQGPPTKRSMISEASKIYDPTGMVAPFIVGAKILFQSTWIRELPWDAPLPDDLAKSWEKWRSCIKDPVVIRLPRLIAPPLSKAFLAIFSDASDVAACSVAFAVADGRARIVLAKTKVAPIRPTSKSASNPPLTIARLELLASVMGIRIAKFVKKALPERFERFVYFTDSLVTLHRIKKGSGSYYQYVSNRLKEIESSSKPSDHYFCPGLLNPSDCGSRGVTMSELQNNQLWWTGPKFLGLPESEWPKAKAMTRQEAADGLGEDLFQQAEQDCLPAHRGEVKVAVVQVRFDVLDERLGILKSRCSKWRRLIRLTAYVFRFFAFSCRKNKTLAAIFRRWSESFDYPAASSADEGGMRIDHTLPYLTPFDLRVAEFYWIKRSQREHFPQAFSHMDNIQQYHDLSSHNAFLDHAGVIRAKTRLELSEIVPRSAVFPILLPRHSDIVELFVIHQHESRGHLAKQSVHFLLKRQFRIILGKREVNRILHKCSNIVCNPPIALRQPFAPLPSYRTDVNDVFTVVGSDFFGPFFIRHKCDVKNCNHPPKIKAWGVLFTCFYSRAVALEIVEDMTTATFLRAFFTVCNRYGRPKVMFTDNAKTYKAADRELRNLFQSIDWEKVGSSAAEQGIEWRWSTEKSPNTNGASERMVRVTKRALKAAFGNALLTSDAARFAFSCAEATINDRPLASTDDDLDASSPITPSLLLLGRLIGTIPNPSRDVDRNDVGLPAVSRMLLHRKRLQLNFWRKWQKDYLEVFRPAKPTKTSFPDLKVGQVVLLREFNLKIGTWKLVRITGLFKGGDDLVRQVTVRTPHGVILTRHIHDLAILECDKFPNPPPRDRNAADNGNLAGGDGSQDPKKKIAIPPSNPPVVPTVFPQPPPPFPQVGLPPPPPRSGKPPAPSRKPPTHPMTTRSAKKK